MTLKPQKRLLTHLDLDEKQQRAIDFGYEQDRGVIKGAKGAGKTVTAMTIATERLADGVNECILITGPAKTASNWQNEYKTWAHLNYRIVMLNGDEKDRRKKLGNSAKLFFVSHNLLAWVFENYPDRFDGLIIDELTKFSNPGSKGVKLLRRVTKKLTFALGLTANPVMETPLDLYAQALVIDAGKTLGTSFDKFKQTYFYQADFNGYQFELRHGMGEQLMRDVAPLFHFMDDQAYVESLPPLIDEPIVVPMDEAVMTDYYNKARADMLVELSGDATPIMNAAVLSGKLEQVVQGAMYDSEGNAHWLHEAKFDALKHAVDTTDSPVVIVFHFDFERDKIKELFPDSLMLGADAGAVDKFNTGNYKVLAMHGRSGGHGLNLQHACHEMILTKPIWSSDVYDQVIGRIWRRGQQHACRRRVLVSPGTIDDLIIQRVDGKERQAGALMAHLQAVAS